MTAAKAPDVTFRMMRYEDIPEVCAIEIESFATPWSEQAFMNELTHNQFAHYVVMEHEGRLIGYGGMWVIIDEAHVTNIAVTGEFRGRKLGERMLAELGDRARRLGANRITLEVRPSNVVARRLYEKFGFEAVGIRPGYYSDNGEDAIIMWAELPFGNHT
ncbi:ribosomal protein S18-alanine N-acetyltransferase [Paenibacillus sp.]|uniref:ribosomal protein S18-alanine N-acetyltransferase n=1 Tax=Paenibacillus sp. TaxID=58172 RepID=UPI002D6A7F80|nr:ribosomal protein S18-alanine N-acetyltransferase [Paenibacillus sp.]HZG86132.1 ribosomal protein S18-alanine N-acetyltransferase [Paenibacillus sp.]